MTDDAELLRQYATVRSEAAFTELVQRHLGFVYQTALRHLNGDRHAADDVAQTVFSALARKAPSLVRRPLLAGWLHTSTRYAALQRIRTENRRQAREQEAHRMNELIQNSGPADEWERLRPVIDDALHALPSEDREAVLMRYFEGREFAEIGARLEISAVGARSRVERALARMQAQLARVGVTSTVAVMAVALANQPVAGAPIGLAATISGTALSGSASATGIAAWIGALTSPKAVALLAVACVGIGVVYWASNRAAPDNRQAESGTGLQLARVGNSSISANWPANWTVAPLQGLEGSSGVRWSSTDGTVVLIGILPQSTLPFVAEPHRRIASLMRSLADPDPNLLRAINTIQSIREFGDSSDDLSGQHSFVLGSKVEYQAYWTPLVDRDVCIIAINPIDRPMTIPAVKRMVDSVKIDGRPLALGTKPDTSKVIVSSHDVRPQVVTRGVVTPGGWLESLRKLFSGSATLPGPPVPPALGELQDKAILRNLRQLGAAGDQYKLENGATPTFSDLVGSAPRKYIKQIVPVAGEDYTKLNFTGDLTVTTSDGRTVTHRN